MQTNKLIRGGFLLVALVLSTASASSSGGQSASGGGQQASLPPEAAMPPGATWAGKWQTSFGPMDIVQMNQGSEFDFGGAYMYQLNGMTVNGLFGAKVQNNTIALQWIEKRGGQKAQGMALWRMLPDGQSFAGVWGNGDSASNGGRWEGRRDDPNRAPVPIMD